MLQPLINLLLYSNFWIAICAASMVWSTQLVLTGRFQLHPLGAFVFFATLLLYALHRLVGLSRAEGFKDKGRYFVIERFQTHIGLYALLAGLATLWFATDTPKTSVFVPLYAQAGGAVGRAFQVGSPGKFQRDSAWWAFGFPSFRK